MQEADIKHLEFIQAIVARQANNSFLLKGWSITVAVALFAFAAKDTDPRFAVLALFPAMAFWALDAYYLRQERLFRELYEHVRHGATGGTRTVTVLCMSTKGCSKSKRARGHGTLSACISGGTHDGTYGLGQGVAH